VQGSAVIVRPVTGRAELRRFLHLPWRMNACDPMWVPPLLYDVRAVLSRSHPFHRHADVQCFLAWRGKEAVGRIAAIVNHAHVEFHGERAGFFGLFECDDDDDAARALLETAADFVRARGMEILRGPFNLSTNDELTSPGILIEGFHRPPSVMMSHNPPWYAGLIEGAGFTKAKDLLAYWVADGSRPPERLLRGLERLQKREGVRIRPLDMKRLNAEVALIQEVYNAAGEKNWGFVPMTAHEIAHLARQLKPVVDPDLCVIAEVNGEPAGFGLALPDFNQVLKRMNGRLLPFGLLKLLWYRRRINESRMLTLGVKKTFRHRGLDTMIILHVLRETARTGKGRGECSWILEDNWEMRRGLERIGAVADKTYRVFEKRMQD
jgi:ribosomal protein S18 acetylase RimI-like enzyme